MIFVLILFSTCSVHAMYVYIISLCIYHLCYHQLIEINLYPYQAKTLLMHLMAPEGDEGKCSPTRIYSTARVFDTPGRPLDTLIRKARLYTLPLTCDICLSVSLPQLAHGGHRPCCVLSPAWPAAVQTRRLDTCKLPPLQTLQSSEGTDWPGLQTDIETCLHSVLTYTRLSVVE